MTVQQAETKHQAGQACVDRLVGVKKQCTYCNGTGKVYDQIKGEIPCWNNLGTRCNGVGEVLAFPELSYSCSNDGTSLICGYDLHLGECNKGCKKGRIPALTLDGVLDVMESCLYIVVYMALEHKDEYHIVFDRSGTKARGKGKTRLEATTSALCYATGGEHE